MKIGIVGGGVVGRATARAFLEHAEVKVFDMVKERATHWLHETLDSDLVFVCLPTPQKPAGMDCDTGVIEDFFKEVSGAGYGKVDFVLRSTVPIGTTRRLREKYNLPNLVHSPEFLTARCSITDAMLPARNIIGAPWFAHGGGIGEGFAALRDLYRSRFPGVPILQMTSDESEAVKLILNSFFAVKVAYFNEVRTLADKLGLDWSTIMEGVLSDGRVAHAHTKVPGPDGKFGFGGTCLPKDLASLAHQLREAGESNAVTLAALERNKIDRERA